jgi:hypothetical protein
MTSPPDPTVARPHIQKTKFTATEDLRLAELVTGYGVDDWKWIAQHMPRRSVRQCRERWLNYLCPSVRNGPWTEEDDALLLKKYAEFGSKWKDLTQFFQGRTEINIKNRYRTLARHRRTFDVLKLPKEEPIDPEQTLGSELDRGFRQGLFDWLAKPDQGSSHREFTYSSDSL